MSATAIYNYPTVLIMQALGRVSRSLVGDQMAPQAIEKTQFADGNGALGE